MKNFLIVIFVLLCSSSSYAEFIKPVSNIISTKAVLASFPVEKALPKMNGTVTFHYGGVNWNDYGEEVAKTFDNVYGVYFLYVEFLFIGKNGIQVKQVYHVPENKIDQFLNMATTFNKDTFVQIDIPMVTTIQEKGKERVLLQHADPLYKIYTDKGKINIECYPEDMDKELLSFDQAVLLRIKTTLLQNTVY